MWFVPIAPYVFAGSALGQANPDADVHHQVRGHSMKPLQSAAKQQPNPLCSLGANLWDGKCGISVKQKQ
jgi:hypothetical protein